jgi:hypothetical protein
VSGQGNVDAREVGLDAIRLTSTGHGARTHDQRAVFERNGCVGYRRLKRVLTTRFEPNGLDAEILERLSQNLVLFKRSRINRTRFARQRSSFFDCCGGPNKRRCPERSGWSRYESRAKVNRVLGCHRS